MKILLLFIVFALVLSAQIPTSITMSPSSGSGTTQTFSVQAIYPAGSGNGDFILLSIGGIPGCTFHFRPNDHVMYIINNAGDGWQQQTAIGANAVLSNSYCGGNANTALTQVYTVNGVTYESAWIQVTLTAAGANPGWTGAYAYSGACTCTSNWVTTGTWTVPQSQIFDSITAVDSNTTIMSTSDVTGDLVRRPTTIEPWSITRKNGQVVKIANAKPKTFANLTHSYEPIGDAFAYHYTIDTSDVWLFRLGLNEDTFWLNDSDNTLQLPKGWTGSTFSWSANDGAEKSTSSEFAIRSKWRPGLLPMYLVNDTPKLPTPAFANTEDNVRIGQATSIFNNSLGKFVIGPAIKPDITADEMKALITKWVDDYGFDFLKPLLSGKTLADIETPADAFEQQILACLRAVEAK